MVKLLRPSPDKVGLQRPYIHLYFIIILEKTLLKKKKVSFRFLPDRPSFGLTMPGDWFTSGQLQT
jgi:hypothetical protein